MAAAAILLSLATICGCIAVACVAIAFATDCWLEYDVNRLAILNTINQQPSAVSPTMVDLSNVAREMNRSNIYFDRTYGLWRQCFPSEIPYGTNVYLSPTDTSCVNIDYPKELDGDLDGYERARIHLMRTIIALFIAAFAVELLCFLVGVFGCWKRSPALLITTGTFMLTAWLLNGGALAVWHGVDYMETHQMNRRPYYLAWPLILQQNTVRIYSWSFILAWIGCGFALLSTVFVYAGAGSLRSERRREKERHAQYVMPVYGAYAEKQPPYYAHAYAGPYYYYNTNTYRY